MYTHKRTLSKGITAFIKIYNVLKSKKKHFTFESASIARDNLDPIFRCGFSVQTTKSGSQLTRFGMNTE